MEEIHIRFLRYRSHNTHKLFSRRWAENVWDYNSAETGDTLSVFWEEKLEGSFLSDLLGLFFT